MARNEKKVSNDRYFDNVDIITARPEGMPYDEYKARMRAQRAVIKQYLKGKFVHVSKIYQSAGMLEHFKLPEGISKSEIMMEALKRGDNNMMLLVKGRSYEKRNDV